MTATRPTLALQHLRDLLAPSMGHAVLTDDNPVLARRTHVTVYRLTATAIADLTAAGYYVQDAGSGCYHIWNAPRPERKRCDDCRRWACRCA